MSADSPAAVINSLTTEVWKVKMWVFFSDMERQGVKFTSVQSKNYVLYTVMDNLVHIKAANIESSMHSDKRSPTPLTHSNLFHKPEFDSCWHPLTPPC